MQKRFGRSSRTGKSAPSALADAADPLASGLLDVSVRGRVLVTLAAMGSLRASGSALCAHVLHVLSVSADPKMSWVHARRVVASMTHRQARGNRLRVGEFPGNPVCVPSLAVDVEHPVTPAVRSTVPEPAVIRSGAVHIEPEPINARSLCKHILLAFTMPICLSGCAMFTKPKPQPFDGRWQFCEVVPQQPLACLPQEDVEKLREQLIRCNSVRHAD